MHVLFAVLVAILGLGLGEFLSKKVIEFADEKGWVRLDPNGFGMDDVLHLLIVGINIVLVRKVSRMVLKKAV